MKIEKDPGGLSSKSPGAKMDFGKAPVFQGVLDYFPRAVEAVANLSMLGAQKYSWKGWASVPDGYFRYKNAAGRHNIKMPIEGEFDQDPHWKEVNAAVLHQTQVVWNEMAALELKLQQMEKEANNALPKSGAEPKTVAQTSETFMSSALAHRNSDWSSILGPQYRREGK